MNNTSRNHNALAQRAVFHNESPHVQAFKRTQEKHSRFSGLVAPDAITIGAIILLLLVGLVMVSSASFPTAGQDDGWEYRFAFKQLIFITVGIVVSTAVYFVPTNTWFKYSYQILLIGIVLLIIIHFPGVSRDIKGAKRWISLGPISVQTSEFVRICVIIYAAAFLQRYQNQIHKSFLAMIRLVGVMCIISMLLLLQPDFGSTVVLFSLVLGMMFLAGVCLKSFFTGAFVLLIAGGVIMFAQAYRVKRLVGYLNPWEDMFGSGYQLVNSLIAIGRGEIFGVGIGESLEKHHYLPEAHTDFIFSILAEETGLVGVIGLMILFTVLVWRSFVIGHNADKARLRFASCVAYGVGLWIGMQALINMSVASGLLPTKGLTLPLISYGGSSVLASLILLAILLRIDSESRYILSQQSPEQQEAQS